MLRCATVGFLLLFLFSFRWLTDDFSQVIMERLRAYHQLYPSEKAYLHLDKVTYTAGDTVWFRAYLAEGSLHTVDSVSKVLYVDLVEKQSGRIVTRRHLRMHEGAGRGDITLADTLRSGGYTIRAYTSWMRNFPEAFFFHKDIQVFRADERGTLSVAGTSSLDLQFFPEGGELVAGLDNRVAFKAIGTSGLGLDVEGFVLNQTTKDTLLGFQSLHLGMGYFAFKPQVGQKYYAIARPVGGTYARYELPAIRPEGYVMRVDNLTNKNSVRVYVHQNLPASAGELTLVAHTRGMIAAVAKGKASQPSFSVSIPKQELLAGITHLTLFDVKNRPVCERLILVDHGHRLNISIKPNKSTYQTRERTELEITATDTAGHPVETTLSLSAIDLHQTAERPHGGTLVSYLLLTSDLAGYVEQPGAYFDPESRNAVIHLDLLLMTQGWRRFRWEEVLQENLRPPTHFVEQGFTISGQVLRPNKKAPGPVSLTFMFNNPDSSQSFLTAETNPSGAFRVYDLDLQDTTRVLVQTVNQRGNRNLTLKIDPLAPPRVTLTKVPFNPISFEAAELEAYLQRTREYQEIERRIRESRERMLKEVEIKGRREPERDGRKLYGTADATIKPTLAMASGAMTIFDLIQGRVAGVNITGSGMNVTVQIRGAANFSGVVEPLFLLDGVPTDKQMMYSVPVHDVESIDILKGASAAIYGSRAGGGVISVLTKRGSDQYDWTQKEAEGVQLVKMIGYSPEREFYAPRYDVSRPENVRPDYRSTLHWAPLVKTDKQGKARVSYFNTDASTRVGVRVEGLTWSGLPGSAEIRYEVR